MEAKSDLDSEARGGGRYLVAVSGSRNSEYLIRWTCAAARRLNATWTALHVQSEVSDAERESIEKNLELARGLGAEVLSVPDEEISAALIRYARIKKATALVIGKADEGGASFLGKRSVMDSILRESGDIDLIVLRGKSPVPAKLGGRWLAGFPKAFKGLPFAFFIFAAITAIGLLSLPAIGYRSVSILYLVAVIFLPFVCDRLSVFAIAVLSGLTWDFLFIPPRMTFSIAHVDDALMLLVFFVAAIVGGFLTSRLRNKEAALSLREERMALLYGFTRALSRVRGIEELAALGSDYISEHLGMDITAYLRGSDGDLDLSRPLGRKDSGNAYTPPSEAVARRCFTEMVSSSAEDERFYLPLRAPDSVLGILVVTANGNKPVVGENRELLATLAGNMALAMERELLAAENEKHKMATESERLTRVLLNHVSHELRTPLTTIKGAVSGLLDNDDDSELRRAMLTETIIACDRLNALVEDLLSMSRLETGALRPRLEKTYVAELLGIAQSSLKAELVGRVISIDSSCRDVEFEVDPVMTAQVFRNVIRNFVAYTPHDAILHVAASVEEGSVSVRFTDNGPGVPERELQSLFKPFYRGSSGAKKQGCGLGLSICRGIVEAHGGTILASLTPGGGLTITVNIPRRGES